MWRSLGGVGRVGGLRVFWGRWVGGWFGGGEACSRTRHQRNGAHARPLAAHGTRAPNTTRGSAPPPPSPDSPAAPPRPPPPPPPAPPTCPMQRSAAVTGRLNRTCAPTMETRFLPAKRSDSLLLRPRTCISMRPTAIWGEGGRRVFTEGRTGLAAAAAPADGPGPSGGCQKAPSKRGRSKARSKAARRPVPPPPTSESISMPRALLTLSR
jgi:hypothetical protein